MLQVICMLVCVKENKLRVYRELKEVFECKKYLYGVPDMGSKLLFRFRSGTHGLNEELGRHITSNVSKACVFCNCDCESVEHVLWECPAYSNNRSVFMVKVYNHLHTTTTPILHEKWGTIM